jgi:site-specific recombinase XerD
MNGLVEQFCDHHHAYNGISAARRVAQRRVLSEFVAFVGEVEELEAETLRRYLGTLVSDQGLKPGTVGQRLTMIRPFVRWLREQRVIDADRMLDIVAVEAPRGARNGKPRPYTRKQIKQMWADLEDAYPWSRRGKPGKRIDNAEMYLARWRRGQSAYARIQAYAERCQVEAVIALALYGGIRREEIFRLELEDMHPDNAYVVVRGARKNRDAEQNVRIVPMTDAMRTALKRWLDLRDELAPVHDRPWLSLHTEQHARKPIRWTKFQALLSKIGRGIEFHRLRHTFATERLRAGMELAHLQKVMGHSRIQQTLAYTEFVHEDLLRSSSRSDSNFERALAREAA